MQADSIKLGVLTGLTQQLIYLHAFINPEGLADGINEIGKPPHSRQCSLQAPALKRELCHNLRKRVFADPLADRCQRLDLVAISVVAERRKRGFLSNLE